MYSFYQYSILEFTVLSGIRFLTAGAYKKPQSLARNRKECLQKSFNRRKVKVKNEEVYPYVTFILIPIYRVILQKKKQGSRKRLEKVLICTVVEKTRIGFPYTYALFISTWNWGKLEHLIFIGWFDNQKYKEHFTAKHFCFDNLVML